MIALLHRWPLTALWVAYITYLIVVYSVAQAAR